MNAVDASRDREAAPTAALAAWIARGAPPLGPRATTWARHALLDWLGVALGGSGAPLVDILIDDAVEEGGAGESRLIGRRERVSPANAALINGAASHALDFDDVHSRMGGHPSVTVLPAVLALAERRRSGGREVLEAFAIGYEVACQVGAMVGRSHDEAGWHATGTAGTFGAVAAAAKLLGLSEEQTVMALGIAATQASGLQSMFGTMCKPLHAGRAAMGGLLAARWASRGFTSHPEALACRHGFAATHSTTFEFGPLPGAGDALAVESNIFKHHAACFLAHAAIEAAGAIRDRHGIVPNDVRLVRVRIPRLDLEACNIPDPRTGAEIKFSLRHLLAMALAGVDTGDVNAYTAATAAREDLIEIRNRIELEAEEVEERYCTEVRVHLGNGETLRKHVDVDRPAEDLDLQWRRLRGKFRRLADPVIGSGRAEQVVSLVSRVEESDNLLPLLETCTGV